jgi:hypothetical protein
VVGGESGFDNVAADELGAADEEDAHASSLVGRDGGRRGCAACVRLWGSYDVAAGIVWAPAQ